MLNSVQVANQSFQELEGVGSVETDNLVEVEVRESNSTVGVKVEQNGPKKAIKMDVVVSTSRSEKGSRRAAKLTLTGRQARQVYEALRNFYEARSDREEQTHVLWY